MEREDQFLRQDTSMRLACTWILVSDFHQRDIHLFDIDIKRSTSAAGIVRTVYTPESLRAEDATCQSKTTSVMHSIQAERSEQIIY